MESLFNSITLKNDFFLEQRLAKLLRHPPGSLFSQDKPSGNSDFSSVWNPFGEFLKMYGSRLR
jgi:hypothetical protein